jgi:hypothetical protein
MGRRTKIIVIDAEGRDKGKAFLITEMSAGRAEKWGMRALHAAVKAGIDIPEQALGAGMAGVAVVGIKAMIAADFEDSEPLFDEMFECVAFCPDPKAITPFARPLVETDTEEVATRVRLRAEVFNLHVGFSQAGDDSLPTSESTSPASSTTRTFPAQ